MQRMMIATFLVMLAATIVVAQDEVTSEYPMAETVQPVPADSYVEGSVVGSAVGSDCGCNGGGTIAAAPVFGGSDFGYMTDYDYGGCDCCPTTYSSPGRMFGGLGFRSMRGGLFSRNRCCCQ